MAVPEARKEDRDMSTGEGEEAGRECRCRVDVVDKIVVDHNRHVLLGYAATRNEQSR